MSISRPHLQGESEVALASSVPVALEHLALLVRVVALDHFASVEMVVVSPRQLLTQRRSWTL